MGKKKKDDKTNQAIDRVYDVIIICKKEFFFLLIVIYVVFQILLKNQVKEYKYTLAILLVFFLVLLIIVAVKYYKSKNVMKKRKGNMEKKKGSPLKSVTNGGKHRIENIPVDTSGVIIDNLLFFILAVGSIVILILAFFYIISKDALNKEICLLLIFILLFNLKNYLFKPIAKVISILTDKGCKKGIIEGVLEEQLLITDGLVKVYYIGIRDTNGNTKWLKSPYKIDVQKGRFIISMYGTRSRYIFSYRQLL